MNIYLSRLFSLQPFAEDCFANHDDRVRFYTGFPGFDVLKATFWSVRQLKEKKLMSLFQEFIYAINEIKIEERFPYLSIKNLAINEVQYQVGHSV